ncbi:hypothetical protein [Veronia pacifica]|uniref:DGQHR domain-containing protein n=1 Tax=Veronia pacifica TaxID=1080227 RepID=A0A1C3EQA0_9GAMM|nr:hypothetical protein [Veronia pacifica]ODA35362.1 hypothetical protein A8L45_04140 [Veronia pacifica]
MLHKLIEKKLRCTSIITPMKISDYLDLIDDVYKDKGGLQGQRTPLKTKTALVIRDRMVKDIQNNAILPPVVIGILVEPIEIEKFNSIDNLDELLKIAKKDIPGRLSVIDGMQRTTAIAEAIELNPSVKNNELRVEFWVSDSLNSLIYRMLVLNTGQVPWEVSRQLNTVYNPLLKIISDKVSGNIDIFNQDEESRRRTRAGQYQSEKLIELLLLFSARKNHIELKSTISEDFARLDIIESSSHERFLDYFIKTIELLTSFDKTISRYESKGEVEQRLIRFKTGKDIFKSFPAMVGFCVAMSIYIFDQPGFDIDWDESELKFEVICKKLELFFERVEKMNNEQLEKLLDIENLDLLLSVKSSKVGQFERNFFTTSFLTLLEGIEKIENSLKPCWRRAGN